MAAPSPFGPEFLVAAKFNSTVPEPAVAVLRDGRSVVAWADSGSNGDVKHRVFDYDGRALTGELAVPASLTGTQEQPAIAALAGGGWVVVWRELNGASSPDAFGNIRFAVFDAAGTRTASGFAPQGQTGPQDEPAVVATADGGFLVGWTDRNGAATGLADGTDAVMLRGFSASGAALGPATRLSGNVGGDRSVALAAGGGTIGTAWDDNGGARVGDLARGIYGRDLSGVPGSNFADGGTKIGGATDASGPITPDVAVTAAGETVRVWEDAGRVWLAQEGGPAREALSGSSFTQKAPKVAALEIVGGFVTAWFEERFATSAQDVFVRVYDAAGNATSAPVLVKTSTGVEMTPDVAGMIDGRFLVSWGEQGDANARARIYDPRTEAVDWTGGTLGERFWGTEFAAGDTLAGGAGDDLLNARGGNDRIAAGEGADTVLGGAGNDRLAGDAGNDSIAGDAGDDSIAGGDGADSITGGAGDDTIDGGTGRDTIDGGDGSDTVTYAGRSGAIVVEAASGGALTVRIGGAVEDRLVAVERVVLSVGDDRASGSSADEVVSGGAGNDSLAGGGGGDGLNGEAGDDTLTGGAGEDRMSGGAGADSFVFAAAVAGSLDRITDFVPGTDEIALAAAGFAALGPRVTATEIAFGTQAADEDDRLIYNPETGRLAYDADGAGGANPVALAFLTGAPALGAGDFAIV
jgi:Ca2+-binding RTX toxin-like protein